jgi:hypothetical protein
MKKPVVPTGAERSEAQWRDLLSAISRLFVERRSLDYASLKPLSPPRRRNGDSGRRGG